MHARGLVAAAQHGGGVHTWGEPGTLVGAEVRAGDVLLDGQHLAALDDDARTLLRRRRMGFVFQAFHLLPHLTVAGNVAFPLKMAKTPAAAIPGKVAEALEGLKFKSYSGDVEMRKTDHQMQQPIYLSVWQKADAKFPYSPENTGMTLALVKDYPAYVSSTPTSCQMKRPAS